MPEAGEFMPVTITDLPWRDITLEQALAGAGVSVAGLLEKSQEGATLGLEDGLRLAVAEGNDLLALVKVADELRKRAVGNHVM